jgi:hypothetical protein
MHLPHQGHPLHTRALGVDLLQEAKGTMGVTASVLDLRKRGFVPVAGDLQPSGIVHQMCLEGSIALADRTVTRLEAVQPTVAFEPSAATGGESCRDVAGNVAGLLGARLDDAWGPRVAAAIGGPRGCYHVHTLAHLLGSTTAWALSREDALRRGAAPRPTGQGVFRRDVVIDGADAGGGRLGVALQATDLHRTDAAGGGPAMDRFAESFELRVGAVVDLATMTFAELTVAERRRDRATIATAAWRSRADLAAWLTGEAALRGSSGRLLARLGEAADDRPILDVLLQLAPALIQVFAALSDDWARTAARDGWILGMGGQADSCWMWRRGGALERLRAPADPVRGI